MIHFFQASEAKKRQRKRRRGEVKEVKAEKKSFRLRVGQLNAKKKFIEDSKRTFCIYPYVLATDWTSVIKKCIVKMLKNKWNFADTVDKSELQFYEEMEDFLFTFE